MHASLDIPKEASLCSTTALHSDAVSESIIFDAPPNAHSSDCADVVDALTRFTEVTGADAETAEYYFGGAQARGLSFEEAVSYYFEKEADNTPKKIQECARTEAVAPNDTLTASELRAISEAAQALSEEDLGWLACSNSNCMPSITATWAWGKDSWNFSVRGGIVSSNAFTPYQQVIADEIEEQYSLWKVGSAPAQCTIEVANQSFSSNAMKKALGRGFGMAKSRKLVINFENMTQMDAQTQQRRPIRRSDAQYIS